MRTESISSQPSIRPSKLSEAIAGHIRQLILEGALQPGERLISERDLAIKLNVSRPSLREALDKLIAEGLLVTDAQGVAYVSDLIGKSLRDPLELLLETPEGRMHCLELRAVIESAAAGYAAERATDIDREVLAERFAAMVKAHDAQEVDDIAKSDAEFHFSVYEASHNLMLLHLMRSLETILRSNVFVNRKNLYEHRDDKDSQLAEHRAIFDAVMAGEPEVAREAARMHMTTALRTQNEIHSAERRLEDSLRRLARRDLVAPPKKNAQDGGESKTAAKARL